MDLSWLLPEIKGIPVLMYHRVCEGMADKLTITPEKLEEQWRWLKAEGYSTLSLQRFIDIASGRQTEYPEKSLLITFDDGYLNNLSYAYPLLQKMGWQATFFVIGGTLDGTYDGGKGPDEKMTIAQLQKIDPTVVQLAMHGYHHEDCNELELVEMILVLDNMVSTFDAAEIPYISAFAYPYGSRPKDKTGLDALKVCLEQMGIGVAFRIGNQVSKIPAPDIYEIKRIDICGTDTMEEFKIKLKKGKLKPF